MSDSDSLDSIVSKVDYGFDLDYSDKVSLQIKAERADSSIESSQTVLDDKISTFWSSVRSIMNIKHQLSCVSRSLETFSDQSIKVIQVKDADFLQKKKVPLGDNHGFKNGLMKTTQATKPIRPRN
jgi:hypothetical protein